MAVAFERDFLFAGAVVSRVVEAVGQVGKGIEGVCAGFGVDAGHVAPLVLLARDVVQVEYVFNIAGCIYHDDVGGEDHLSAVGIGHDIGPCPGTGGESGGAQLNVDAHVVPAVAVGADIVGGAGCHKHHGGECRQDAEEGAGEQMIMLRGVHIQEV